MQMVIGALIFGIGAFCGAGLYGAGQQKRGSQKERLIKEKVQDAILTAFDKNAKG